MMMFLEKISALLFLLRFWGSRGIAPPYYGIDRPALDYELPPLPFGYDDLEPYIDGKTVRVHYNGHHSKYIENLNVALQEWRKHNKPSSRFSLVEILRNLSRVPVKWREIIRNNGGGFVNHNFYWAVLSPNPEGESRLPQGSVADDIYRKWGSFIDFKDVFNQEALSLFGSGYVWLCRNISRYSHPMPDLIIVQTSNQDSPLGLGLYPLLVIDIWEHAYYLKHQNLRFKYIQDWWHVVDWAAVAQLDNWWKGVRFHDEL